MNNTFKVEFYKTVAGDSPVEQFLDSLEPKLRAKTLRMISLLKEYGNELREPYSKHLTNGIFELRTIQGSNITRVLYFFFVEKQIILVNGFIKKSKKTPANELELALKYRTDYLSRKEL